MFRKYSQNSCVLCDSNDELTGEHKIKRSQISHEFGKGGTWIGNPNAGIPLKFAQGPKSKSYYFKSPICKNCNGNRTQAADREFDQFHREVLLSHAKGNALNSPFLTDRYRKGSKPYLNLLRFFAKQLCCQLGEDCGPIPHLVSEFAIGNNETNYIMLDIRESYSSISVKKESEDILPYAAHGGLVVYCKKKGGGPTAFVSSISIGSIQYVYSIRMKWFARLALKIQHRNYYEWCKNQALQHPLIDEAEIKSLGID